MAVPPARFYACDIPSIHQTNPSVPAMLGDLDLRQMIAAGDPVRLEDLTHACGVVDALKARKESGDGVVTEELLTSAQLRMSTVETAHRTAAYPQLNEVMNQLRILAANTQSLEDHLQATNTNTRIIARNLQCHLYHEKRPLQKTRPGHGLALALAAAQSLDPAVLQTIVVPTGPLAIGMTPPSYNPHLQDYQHEDILKLIVFYNDDFRIKPEDTLELRTNKFFEFLCGR